ncbi:hypothetical protein Pyn_11563 [Prunus yedoensis var. nudiflora]|uniref:Uncharacterized protein n=1 Tax=Prunus yedoensis var. nudiflora TaxID=2094558 RepID=A0A314ZE94_PRUYE|nr:hypothetical protein Pyn_11563 [Prunus yedoensis var. nudiflora]
MAPLRSNLIRKQFFKNDMRDVMKSDVVAPQVGPFNFGLFPPPPPSPRKSSLITIPVIHIDMVPLRCAMLWLGKKTRIVLVLEGSLTALKSIGAKAIVQLARTLVANVFAGDDAAELSQSLWGAEVPDSLEEAASEMDTMGKMDITT